MLVLYLINSLENFLLTYTVFLLNLITNLFIEINHLFDVHILIAVYCSVKKSIPMSLNYPNTESAVFVRHQFIVIYNLNVMRMLLIMEYYKIQNYCDLGQIMVGNNAFRCNWAQSLLFRCKGEVTARSGCGQIRIGNVWALLLYCSAILVFWTMFFLLSPTKDLGGKTPFLYTAVLSLFLCPTSEPYQIFYHPIINIHSVT